MQNKNLTRRNEIIEVIFPKKVYLSNTLYLYNVFTATKYFNKAHCLLINLEKSKTRLNSSLIHKIEKFLYFLGYKDELLTVDNQAIFFIFHKSSKKTTKKRIAEYFFVLYFASLAYCRECVVALTEAQYLTFRGS